jgi:hypothetical protein
MIDALFARVPRFYAALKVAAFACLLTEVLK